MSENNFGFLEGPASDVAPLLLGCELERTVDGHLVRVKIVETEAYDQSDAASHSYNGSTARTEVMFGPSGRLYVYFTYGMHYCCNIVVGPTGHGAAVLLRAAQPLSGLAAIAARRPNASGHNLTNGPAKLCQALDIDRRLNGHDLSAEPLKLIIKESLPAKDIKQTTRIGLSRAKEVQWRFLIDANRFVSRAR